LSLTSLAANISPLIVVRTIAFFAGLASVLASASSHALAQFSGTIADNISGFDPDLDMQHVIAAAIAAQVHADIIRAPMQYLTLVG
jgi:ABC-type bacteriocin/lantibiotic exporter with double-glycine peptidase domain